MARPPGRGRRTGEDVRSVGSEFAERRSAGRIPTADNLGLVAWGHAEYFHRFLQRGKAMAFAANKVSAHSFAWEIELTAILANFGLPPANVHALLNAAGFRQPLPT
jgi:hypothetical protein